VPAARASPDVESARRAGTVPAAGASPDGEPARRAALGRAALGRATDPIR
jgi:hypothetical protein